MRGHLWSGTWNIKTNHFNDRTTQGNGKVRNTSCSSTSINISQDRVYLANISRGSFFQLIWRDSIWSQRDYPQNLCSCTYIQTDKCQEVFGNSVWRTALMHCFMYWLFSPSAYSVLINYLVKAKEDEALLHRQQPDILSPAFIIVLSEVFLKSVGLIVAIQVKSHRLRFLDSLIHEGKRFTKINAREVPWSSLQRKDEIIYRLSKWYLS